LQQQRVLGLCSALCWPRRSVSSRNIGHPTFRHLLDTYCCTTGLQIPALQQCQEPVDRSQRLTKRLDWIEQGLTSHILAHFRDGGITAASARIVATVRAHSVSSVCSLHPKVHQATNHPSILTAQWPTQEA